MVTDSGVSTTAADKGRCRHELTNLGWGNGYGRESPAEGTRSAELTREQARELFDRRARAELNMSGEEFIRAWEAGELDPDDDHVIALWMILPFAR
jgi:hypothetical protein